MRSYRLCDLPDAGEGHILRDVLPGKFIAAGGLSFAKPGGRSHTNDGPGGRDRHVHQDCEAFLIIQGKGYIEIDRTAHPIKAGDLIVVEPGEDHHLVSGLDDPLVTLWCHAGSTRKIPD